MDSNLSYDKRKPLVSVIISVFNEENYIRESILSIVNQSYTNLEIIIIDDYCTDNSISIINEFIDPRIILYQKTNEPRYLASSRNIGINLAKGEYIILHDADDTSEKDRIEKQLNKAMSLNCEVVIGCYVNKIYSNGFNSKMVLPIKHEDIIKGFTRIRNRATIVSGTILASSSIFKHFKYNEYLKYGQDWDHMLRMYESMRIFFYNYPEFLYNYYQRPKNVIKNPDWVKYNILIRINQKRRLAGKDDLKSLEDLNNFLRSPLKFIFWGSLLIILKINLYLKSIKTTPNFFKFIH
jgi:glycosyltransferase involved in cell wall biosynthesis